MNVYKVSRPDTNPGQWVIYGCFSEVEAEFDGAEEGDSIVVAVEEMSQQDFESLPDFQGW